MRIVVGMIILVMAAKVLVKNASAIAADARVLVNLYGAQMQMDGFWLGGLVLIMGAIGVALMLLGVVTLRRARRG